MPPKPKQRKKQQPIYLDNNGTTKICKPAEQTMIKWLGCMSNPSGSSKISTSSKQMIDTAKKNILAHCGGGSKYTVVFTSGSSESNCLILNSCVEAYRKNTKKKPHVITSSIEHKSIIKCCEKMIACDVASVTYISPNSHGVISPDLVKKAIRADTCLISIMSANNEIGSVNPIGEIGKVAHRENVPFHTDAVQTFGKYKINMPKNCIDAMSVSMHKLYGPMGIGFLIINNELVNGYKLDGQISGTQLSGLRGGTENVPAIAATNVAIKDAFVERTKKNRHLMDLKDQVIEALESKYSRCNYKDYFIKKKPPPFSFVILGPDPSGCIAKHTALSECVPNTLLIAFVNPAETFCNVNLKAELNKQNIIISIGSACNTGTDQASHVLNAIRAPMMVKKGVIRISFSDSNTCTEITTFCKILITAVNKINKQSG